MRPPSDGWDQKILTGRFRAARGSIRYQLTQQRITYECDVNRVITASSSKKNSGNAVYRGAVEYITRVQRHAKERSHKLDILLGRETARGMPERRTRRRNEQKRSALKLDLLNVS